MLPFRYTNPLLTSPAHALRDHAILKVGPRWYLTGTSAPYWRGANPGVRLFVSDNLLDWDDLGWLINATKLPANCPYLGRFWAPEIHAHPSNGKFYLTVNSGHAGPKLGDARMDDHAIFLFVAETVTGPYSPVAGPIGQGFKNDASLFTDANGQSYLYASGGGLWQARIDLTTGKIEGTDLQKICGPKDPGNPDWMIGGIEGPFLLHRHGAYHLFFSAWTRGYEIGVLTGPTPLGPWTLSPREPIFGCRKRAYREPQMKEGRYDHLVFTDTDDPFVETGHCAIFEGPDGGDWISCHYLPQGKEARYNGTVLEYTDTHPSLGIEPLRWRDGHFAIDGPTWTEQVITK